ncbi:hypothetical protein NQ318_016114 [Aromia moschata]|uniref:DUF4817 domain-containing protein n=1 Tax=Aromia moschata TaxID=1265417 RepID=A0AAV8XDW5_9CUCU|nr:hypothetical protein NQ318_016114 [Aromia moschata]
MPDPQNLICSTKTSAYENFSFWRQPVTEEGKGAILKGYWNLRRRHKNWTFSKETPNYYTFLDARFANESAGCGDKTRTQKQVCEIFNTKCPDRRIYQSTVSRIENKFREFGNVTDIPKSELNDDDPDRRLEFCEIMAHRC